MKVGRSISCYIYTTHSDMRLWTVHSEQLTAGVQQQAVHLVGMQRDRLSLTAEPSPGRRWCWGMGRIKGVALIITQPPVQWQQPVWLAQEASQYNSRTGSGSRWIQLILILTRELFFFFLIISSSNLLLSHNLGFSFQSNEAKVQYVN